MVKELLPLKIFSYIFSIIIVNVILLNKYFYAMITNFNTTSQTMKEIVYALLIQILLIHYI